MPPAAVLFDVDGTLVDSNYQHVTAWFDAFRRHGYDVDAAALHRCLGMGSDRLVPHVLGHDDENVRRAHSNYYSPALENLRPFPQAAQLLAATAELGLAVLLATSASAAEAERLTAAIGDVSCVRKVLTKDDVTASKPSPQLVEAGLAAAGVAPERALMVGDSVWDVRAAGKAGVRCVALRCGGFGTDELREAGAVAVYDDPGQLLAELGASPIGALAHEEER